MTLLSPSVSVFGLSVATDEAASVKNLSKFEDYKKKEKRSYTRELVCTFQSLFANGTQTGETGLFGVIVKPRLGIYIYSF